MIQPQRALVRPRAYSPASGEPLLLEELVQAFWEERERAGKLAGTVIQLAGSVGSGKSTALAHLAVVLPQSRRILFLDGERPFTGFKAGPTWLEHPIAICVYPTNKQFEPDLVLQLADWSEDDLLEYLLAAHPRKCASVIARVRKTRDRDLPEGNPLLWTAALDEMAADESLRSMRPALERWIYSRFQSADERWHSEELAIAAIAQQGERVDTAMEKLMEMRRDLTRSRLLQMPVVLRLLAARGLVSRVQQNQGGPVLACPLGTGVIMDVAAEIAASEPIQQYLRSLLSARNTAVHPMAASLLVAAGANWRPGPTGPVNLQHGYFAGVDWHAAVFPSTPEQFSNLAKADFTEADLTGAWLEGAIAVRTCFQRAKLTSASLTRMNAEAADLSQADLSGVVASEANFSEASLEGAVLTEANFTSAHLTQARLKGARCVAADFRGATLERADIEEADFTGANFERAILRYLKLRQAILTGAIFTEADLLECDLEGVELERADFRRAVLFGAWLTGSKMPRGNFSGANLKNTGLADIQWEEATLRGADLRGCSFHMGSTRCGLVGSPYPGEGSKTGFYTDDYHDQSYKRPEEIRKANLCGADLRGARLDGVDFYLVDLRDAKFDGHMLHHLRRCGAILHDRCPE